MHAKTFGALALVLAPAAAAWSPAPAPYTVQPQSRLWVEGGSTVRGYECRAGRIDGTIVADGAATVAQLQEGVKRVEIGVPVALLDCGNGTMNGHMRDALKVENHPMIRYRVNSHTVTSSSDDAGKVRMNGTLSIAGREKPVAIDATLAREAGGVLRVKGSKQIRMTEFGVKPPTLMFGTMRVHDPVTVHFDVLLKP